MCQTKARIQTLALLIDLIYNSIIDSTGHTLSCTLIIIIIIMMIITTIITIIKTRT